MLHTASSDITLGLLKSPRCVVKCWVEMPGLALDNFSWKWCSGINICTGLLVLLRTRVTNSLVTCAPGSWAHIIITVLCLLDIPAHLELDGVLLTSTIKTGRSQVSSYCGKSVQNPGQPTTQAPAVHWSILPVASLIVTCFWLLNTSWVTAILLKFIPLLKGGNTTVQFPFMLTGPAFLQNNA